MSEEDRESVRVWLKQFGVDPVMTVGYRIEGDQLRVWQFHGDRPHRRCAEGDLGDPDDVCKIERVV